jgi:ABC-2 type transport system permease protein
MYIACRTIVEKEVKRVFRLWIQTILPAVVTTTLYFLIFGTFIGSQVKSVGGVSYMAFIIPGLVLMTIVNSAFQGMLFSFYFMKFQKTVEEILVSPMPHALVVTSYVVSALVRGAIVGGLVFFVGFLFEPVTVMHPLIALLVGALTSVLFSLIGLVNAVYAKNFDDLNIISTFLLTPLTYLGGIFYGAVWRRRNSAEGQR